MARIYTDASTDAFEGFMKQRGYRRRTENIHAFSPLPQADAEAFEAQWRPVHTPSDWEEKIAIHAFPSTASDGYDVAPEDWLTLERQKSHSGKLTFWLYFESNVPVATTGLIRCADGVLRIKNFFVRADRRREGMGKRALRNMLLQLATAGEMAVVVLSIEGSVGEHLYRSGGARDIGRIYEWSRALG